jgi:DNA-binding NtrC family response regulator
MEYIDLRTLVVSDDTRFVRSDIANCFTSLGAELGTAGWRVSKSDLQLTFSSELLSPTAALNLFANPENGDQFDAIFLCIEATATDFGSYVTEWSERLPRAGLYRPFVVVWSNTIKSSDIRKIVDLGVNAVVRDLDPFALLSILYPIVECRKKRELQRSLVAGLESIDPSLRTDSGTMQACLSLAAANAGLFSQPILIHGPMGSGKASLARAIHHYSSRGARPFESVACGSIRSSVLAGEELGFEHATVDGSGALARAHTGTLFLADLELLDLPTQSSLLHVMRREDPLVAQTKQDSQLDVRFICATTQELRDAVEKQQFSEELYRLLECGLVEVPGLNERREDIPSLARCFLRETLEREQEPPESVAFACGALKVLESYDWTNNILGLRTVVERSALAALEAKVAQIDSDCLVFDPCPLDARKCLDVPIDIGRLAHLRPKSGPQQELFDALLRETPNWVRAEDLLSKTVYCRGDQRRAYEMLELNVSRLQRKLELHGFTIDRHPDWGCRLSAAGSKAA